MLLLEGRTARLEPLYPYADRVSQTKGSFVLWGFELAPQRHQNGIMPPHHRSRVLGDSSIERGSALITRAVRGGFAGVTSSVSEGNECYSGQYHGVRVLLRVSDQRYTHPLAKAFVQACQDYGLPYNPDFNGNLGSGLPGHQATRSGLSPHCRLSLSPARGLRNLDDPHRRASEPHRHRK